MRDDAPDPQSNDHDLIQERIGEIRAGKGRERMMTTRARERKVGRAYPPMGASPIKS